MGRIKLTRKQGIKIGAATSVIIFSLLACFSGAYSWFTSINTMENEGDDFSITRLTTSVQEITFHEYLGETDEIGGTTYYSFNPEYSGRVYFDSNGEAHQTGSGIELGEYSLDNPSHPLLMMFKVAGSIQRIDFETEYSFLAEDNNYSITQTVGTYSAFEALDPNSFSDGNHVKVNADEEHGGVSTIYEFDGTTKTFSMVWIDLAQNDNPLSSVITFHSLGFTGTINDNVETYDVSRMNEFGHMVTEEDVSGIVVDTADLTDSNKSQFADFEDEDSYEFHKSINAFAGDIKSYTYIGIVANYNTLALEYIFFKYLGHDYLSDGLTFKCDWVTKV